MFAVSNVLQVPELFQELARAEVLQLQPSMRDFESLFLKLSMSVDRYVSLQRQGRGLKVSELSSGGDDVPAAQEEDDQAQHDAVVAGHERDVHQRLLADGEAQQTTDEARNSTGVRERLLEDNRTELDASWSPLVCILAC